MTHVVEVDGLGKTYTTKDGPFEAVRDVTFHVDDNEIVSIVGPSGAGKTTVLRTVAGLQTYDRGEVRVLGNRVERPPADLAMVFQDYSRSLLPWMSIEGNVMLPLRSAGVPRDEARRRAAHALKSVGIEGRGSAKPQQLSGGMQQRVAIARAIASRPRLLVMDEPFASVDAQTRMDLEDLVLPLRDEYEMAILFVTHDVDESVYLSDRVVVLTRAPSEIAEIVPIELGPSRNQFDTKERPEFAHARHRIFELIRRPVAA
ncbi:ABC transporter ATP-binding protein [Microbacterium sp.]|uniref:ABC transporter ATP-binding protein n=1 Tax=Microbacterium sp. TaxID=51671 RepID=UPI003A894E3D